MQRVCTERKTEPRGQGACYKRGMSQTAQVVDSCSTETEAIPSEEVAEHSPPSVLAHRIGSMMAVHADPWRMPSFVDNHDVDRLLASSDETGLRQALLAMLTLPGIPVIYYGTEQGFREPRAAMFAAAAASAALSLTIFGAGGAAGAGLCACADGTLLPNTARTAAAMAVAVARRGCRRGFMRRGSGSRARVCLCRG